MSSVESKRYEIKALLGEGGFGKVYHASMRGPDGFRKDVAIKVLHDADPRPAILKRFRDEARILGLVRDRAIVVVDSPTRIGNHWAVVMELVDGASAGAILKRGPFPSGVAAEVVGEIARVLNKVWSQPGPDGQPLHLLHRDIKPDNIQITSSGEIKLLDFGIAKADFEDREFKTRQSIGGTPGYMAPERLLGIEGPEGDIYSLGIMLHELVTGERPLPAGPLARATGSQTLDVNSDEFDLPPTDDRAEPVPADPVLDLARRMTLEDRLQRPVARDVERECAELRRRLSGPSLRDWAEQVVQESHALPADAFVGAVVTETMSVPLPTTSSVGAATPAPAPSTSRRSSMPVVLGLLGLAGGLGILGVVAGAVAFGLTFGAMSVSGGGGGTDPVPTDGTELVPPDPRPVAPEPVGVVPEPAPELPEPASQVPDPAPVVPEPAPGAPSPVVPRPERPTPVPAPDPQPAPVPVAPEPAAPAPEPAVAATGRFRLTGDATSLKLVGRDRLPYGPGEDVPAGKYQMQATFPVHGQVELGTVDIRAGATITIDCISAMANCREN
ncbi:MAG: serine/threonine protein kinase [Alphaproteobacteria bacterium]|nr:serine/threonine protein kinase [Alphaproteobacteria bacterium]MCB9698445.1 serine/threonine protein kinase [Alphaproteobacteria bacterium]